MQPQFITDTKGKKISAVLAIRDYEMILEQLDELACIKEYDKVKARKNRQFIPLKEALRQVEKTRRK